jgi:hypothetical protein
MAGHKAASGFEFLDAIVDRPDHGELVFVNGIVVAAFVIRIGDLQPGAIFLLLPRRAEPGGIAKFALSLQTTTTDPGITFPHLATGKRGLKQYHLRKSGR